jgi:predicted transcriptional regulator
MVTYLMGERSARNLPIFRTAAYRALSCRVDNEGYYAIFNLSEAINTSASVLMRLAIHDLVEKQKRVKARCLQELMAVNGD